MFHKAMTMTSEEQQELEDYFYQDESNEEPAGVSDDAPSAEKEAPKLEASESKGSGEPETPVDLAARFAILEQQLKGAQGRIASLQSESDKSKNQKPQESPKWDALREADPDWALAVEEQLNRLAATDVVDELRKKHETLSVSLGQMRLDAVHPGWREVRETPEFLAFWQSMPPDVTDRWSGNVDAAPEAFDLFKKINPHIGSKEADSIASARDITRKVAAAKPERKVGGDRPLSLDALTDEEYFYLDKG